MQLISLQEHDSQYQLLDPWIGSSCDAQHTADCCRYTYMQLQWARCMGLPLASSALSLLRPITKPFLTTCLWSQEVQASVLLGCLPRTPGAVFWIRTCGESEYRHHKRAEGDTQQ
jgi:hypothetical protein